MKRYAYIDDNLLAQIRWLWLFSGLCLLALILAILGWIWSMQSHRLSLPPLLDYGGHINTNEIQNWEVYNFAGYVWQALNRCSTDCSAELPTRLGQMRALVTTEFAKSMHQEYQQRRAQLLGRERYLVPLVSAWNSQLVQHLSPGRWQVQLDVQLIERIGTTEVKKVPIRYLIEVIENRVDPVFNPWGLFLHRHAAPPQRLPAA